MNKNEQLIIFNTSKYEPYLSKKSLRNEIQILRDELQLLKTQIQLHHQTETRNQTKFNNSVKETFFYWSKRTDINCYNKIFEYENGCARFFWLIVLLTSVGITALIMSLSVEAYLRYGVISEIKVVYERPTEFPAVTICDNDQFTTQQGLDFVQMFYDSDECQNVSNYYGWIYDKKTCALEMATNQATSHLFDEEKRKMLGLSLEQILCKYNGSECTNDLHSRWQFDFGNCFQFNVGLNSTNGRIDKLMANIEGFDYGILLNITNFTRENIHKWGTYEGEGMRVFVHNRSVEPRWYSEGVFVRPGELTFIAITRTFVRNTPAPYTSCTDLTSYHSLLYDFIVNKNRTYRQKDCFDLCLQKMIIDACGCHTTLYENIDLKSKPCLNINDFNCFQKVYFQVDTVKCALEYCPLECETVQYDLSVSSLVYPNFDEYNSLNVNLSYEEWRKHFLQINIFYRHLEYTLIEELPAMTMSNLIANLGGIMSLIVSMSFFTLIEIGELFVLIGRAFVLSLIERSQLQTMDQIKNKNVK